MIRKLYDNISLWNLMNYGIARIYLISIVGRCHVLSVVGNRTFNLWSTVDNTTFNLLGNLKSRTYLNVVTSFWLNDSTKAE